MSSTGDKGFDQDTFDEAMRDRIVLHLAHLRGDELLRISGLCIELRMQDGSL